MQTHVKQGIRLAPGMEIGYAMKNAKRWEVDPGGQLFETPRNHVLDVLRPGPKCRRKISLRILLKPLPASKFRFWPF